MRDSVMDFRVSKEKELQWRISSRRASQKLMIRWLPFLGFLMVRHSILHIFLLKPLVLDK